MLLSEEFLNKAKALSGILSEEKREVKEIVIKENVENIDKFNQIKDYLYQNISKDQLDRLYTTFESLTDEQKRMVRNLFIGQVKNQDSVGNLVFKLKKAISVFSRI